MIGTVGRMEAVKDPLNLVRAFVVLLDMLPEHRARLRLAMAGDGALREEVLAMLQSAGVQSSASLPERVTTCRGHGRARPLRLAVACRRHFEHGARGHGERAPGDRHAGGRQPGTGGGRRHRHARTGRRSPTRLPRRCALRLRSRHGHASWSGSPAAGRGAFRAITSWFAITSSSTNDRSAKRSAALVCGNSARKADARCAG